MLILLSFILFDDMQSIPKHYIVQKTANPIENLRNELDSIPSFPGSSSYDSFSNATSNSSNIDIDALISLSQNKHGPATFFLGDMYLYGISPATINLTKAYKFYKKAAQYGIISAYSQLGFLYSYGLGVERNMAKATVYHRIASMNGSIHSTLWESFAYRYGNSKPLSLSNAIIKIFSLADLVNILNNENLISHHEPEMLTRLLKLKKDVAHNENALFELLTYQGTEAADIHRAHSYYYGQYGQEVNVHKARQIFEQYPNNDDALVHLGRIHHLGQDGPVDIDLAEQYYFKAAEMKNINAYNNLAVIYGAKNRDEEALELLEKAANQGHTSAKYNLAMKKIKIPENRSDGLRMLRELGDDGFIFAQFQFAQFERSGFAPFNETDAFRRFADICSIGPWREEALVAEHYYKQNRIEAAVLKWMELSDMGYCEGSYNAGLVLLGWPKFAKSRPKIKQMNSNFLNDDNLRKKLATIMMKNAKNQCSRKDISPFLYEAYWARNMTDKAFKTLILSGTDPEVSFLKIQMILDHQLPLYFMRIKKEFEKAIEKDPKSILPLLLHVPRLIYRYFLVLTDFISEAADNSAETMDNAAKRDFIQFSLFILSILKGPFYICLCVSAFCSLIQIRIKSFSL